jgi:cell division protease FtsH
LVADAYRRAKQLLIDNRHVLDRIAKDLVDRETVDAEELQQILETNELKLAAAL